MESGYVSLLSHRVAHGCLSGIETRLNSSERKNFHFDARRRCRFWTGCQGFIFLFSDFRMKMMSLLWLQQWLAHTGWVFGAASRLRAPLCQLNHCLDFSGVSFTRDMEHRKCPNFHTLLWTLSSNLKNKSMLRYYPSPIDSLGPVSLQVAVFAKNVGDDLPLRYHSI